MTSGCLGCLALPPPPLVFSLSTLERVLSQVCLPGNSVASQQ